MESVSEGEGAVQVCATLSGPGVSGGSITSVPITVMLDTTQGSDDTGCIKVSINSIFLYIIGSALENTDYTTISSALMFPAGSANTTVQCVNITITDDDIFEGDETFTVGLTVNTSGVMEGNTITAITITDNEGYLYYVHDDDGL